MLQAEAALAEQAQTQPAVDALVAEAQFLDDAADELTADKATATKRVTAVQEENRALLRLIAAQVTKGVDLQIDCCHPPVP